MTHQVADARPVVLVIDEHEDSRIILRAILEHGGFAVVEAEDPRLAGSLAREVRPVAMIIELDMRQLTGVETLMLIRLDQGLQLCPIIASASHERAEQALASGFQGFAAKPFNIKSLLDELRTLTASPLDG